jgi:hypothetical protein
VERGKHETDTSGCRNRSDYRLRCVGTGSLHGADPAIRIDILPAWHDPGLRSDACDCAERRAVRNIETRIGESGEAHIDLTLDIQDKKHLEKLVTAMRKVSGVRDVERLYKV